VCFSDFELSQLQERLMETEVVMETLVNSSGLSHDSPPCVSLEQEQSLLQQLTAITQVMRSNHLVQDFTPFTPSEEGERDERGKDEHQELAPQTADQPDEDRPIRDKNWEINNALASPTEEREMESDRGEEEEREEEKRQETVNRCLEERKNWEGMSQNAQHEKKEIQREGEERAAREEERGWRNFEGEKRDGEREKRREKSLQSREERHLTLERRGEEEKAEQREREEGDKR
uniref:Uncharacterized protein n=1 Tax=Periophthalmus magnuspinnatus TaxID=409849 RepID=A0A3B4B9C1_9GOBI